MTETTDEPIVPRRTFSTTHVWRSYAFFTRSAPAPGFYCVGREPPVYLRRGDPMARCHG
jgi:hypothetical protein